MNDVPSKLAHYEIFEEVGRGGFATVHEARDTRLGRQVALKIICVDMCGNVWQWATNDYSTTGRTLRGGGWNALAQQVNAIERASSFGTLRQRLSIIMLAFAASSP